MAENIFLNDSPNSDITLGKHESTSHNTKCCHRLKHIHTDFVAIFNTTEFTILPSPVNLSGKWCNNFICLDAFTVPIREIRITETHPSFIYWLCINVCSPQLLHIWCSTAHWSPTFPVGSICHLPAITGSSCHAIGVQYGHRTSSVACLVAWNSLPYTLHDLKTSFLSSLEYTAH